MTVMTKTPIGQPWADGETGTYWPSPNEVTLAEVHPLLMTALLMLPDYQVWSLCSVDVYDMDSGAPLGSFDIGFDQGAAERAATSTPLVTNSL
jgi:hypothetical protein